MKISEKIEFIPITPADSSLLDPVDRIAQIAAAFRLPNHLVSNGVDLPMPTATLLLGRTAVALSLLSRAR